VVGQAWGRLAQGSGAQLLEQAEEPHGAPLVQQVAKALLWAGAEAGSSPSSGGHW
jgi:hypothetical protein